MPQEFGSSRPQHVGGSELTQVPAQIARDGKAVGSAGDPFKQILQVTFYAPFTSIGLRTKTLVNRFVKKLI